MHVVPNIRYVSISAWATRKHAMGQNRHPKTGHKLECLFNAPLYQPMIDTRIHTV